MASDLTFDPAEDWRGEDEDDVEATGLAFAVLEGLVVMGHKVDVMSLWTEARPEGVTSQDVHLGQVGRDSFRFFENRRFELLP